jgi:hypothetical protein
MSLNGSYDKYFGTTYDSEDIDDFQIDNIKEGIVTMSLLYVEHPCKKCIVMAGHIQNNTACTCVWNDGIRKPNPCCTVYVYEKMFPVRLDHPRWKILRSRYSIDV